jgi:hypothetical protein
MRFIAKRGKSRYFMPVQGPKECGGRIILLEMILNL